MPRLILLLAIAVIGYIVYQRLNALPPAQRNKAYVKVGLGVLVAVVLLLTVTGRMHWLGAAVTGLIVGASRLMPLLLRLFPMWQWLQRNYGGAGSTGGGGQQSKVETSLLRMVLDHATGDMKGEVLSGDFAGRQLDELERSQLEELLAWCRSRDGDSARLLESYLTTRFGAESDYQKTPPGGSDNSMNRTEALAILGLDESASEADIVSAHRKLMQKLHPDRGGNDYLAAKLNQAKDELLG